MSDEPSQDHEPSGGGFLSTTKGIVTGITSLVVAITGLTVACDKLLPDDAAPAKVESAASVPPDGEPAGAEAAPEEGDPSLYTGDKLRMEWTGKTWQLSSPDGVFTYEEMLSTEGNWILGFDKAQNEYIRWPKDGGTMEYSTDDRQSWITYGEVMPASE